MIKTFLDEETARLFYTKESRKIPAEIRDRAFIKLHMIDSAYSINDLKTPPSNHLEALKGDLKGFYSIRINKRYRIIFRFVEENAYDVAIVDYHR
ncbi:MAG: type II toxin-antitoxin system RelE/ParE family toxin [Hydrogenothermaceae bacterium]